MDVDDDSFAQGGACHAVAVASHSRDFPTVHLSKMKHGGQAAVAPATQRAAASREMYPSPAGCQLPEALGPCDFLHVASPASRPHCLCRPKPRWRPQAPGADSSRRAGEGVTPSVAAHRLSTSGQARRIARHCAASVAPVVRTSSTTTTDHPASLGPARGWKALETLPARAERGRERWERCCRARSNGVSGAPSERATPSPIARE